MTLTTFATALFVVGSVFFLPVGITAAEKSLPGKLNPQLMNFPDNIWLKLEPARHPRSGMYSGCCCIGEGKFWFSGGEHGAYKYNDVELYDIASNQWTRLTDKEAWAEVKGTGAWEVDGVCLCSVTPCGHWVSTPTSRSAGSLRGVSSLQCLHRVRGSSTRLP